MRVGSENAALVRPLAPTATSCLHEGVADPRFDVACEIPGFRKKLAGIAEHAGFEDRDARKMSGDDFRMAVSG